MKLKKTQDEFDGKLTSLSQKVGVSIIGILTALGTGLIIYTGVMAATYDVSQQENQYLKENKKCKLFWEKTYKTLAKLVT